MFGGVQDQYGAPPIGRKPLKNGQMAKTGPEKFFSDILG